VQIIVSIIATRATSGAAVGASATTIDIMSFNLNTVAINWWQCGATVARIGFILLAFFRPICLENGRLWFRLNTL